MKTLVLLDSHAILHRAYHALPPFTSKKTGEPTGGLYGFSTMLIRVIKELKPDYIAAAVDLPAPTFRDMLYKEYKAKRPEADMELISQLKRLPDLIHAFGIEVLSAPGFEADDILGTIVEQTQKNPTTASQLDGLRVIIVSGDMDTLQLVEGESVLVYTMRRGMEDTVLYDENKMKERFGFPPTALPDFKGLKGDPSDNIIGVKGIGEKTATDIIKNFGTLENLYKELEKISPSRFAGASARRAGGAGILKERIVKLLLEHKKDAFFSKMLATIRRDAPIKFSAKGGSASGGQVPGSKFQVDKEVLITMFEELGFDSLIKRLEGV